MPLNNSVMDWDKLRIFHAVADAGSFTHAGHELGLSQSAVSRQISALEDALNVPLFHRHARGLILTEQGEMLYRTAHEVFTKLTAAQTRLMDSKEKPSGELRITTTVGLGSVWLTPRLKEFSELYPEIAVTLLLDDRELDLSMREADVAVRLRRPTQPDLIQRKLFTVHHHLYASADYLKKHGIPKSLEDLDKHKILTFGQAPNYRRPSTGWNMSAAPKAIRARWRCASTMPMACAARCRRAWASPRWPTTSCRRIQAWCRSTCRWRRRSSTPTSSIRKN